MCFGNDMVLCVVCVVLSLLMLNFLVNFWCSCLGLMKKQKLLLNTFIIIILFIYFCDGQAINAAMFEIEQGDQKSYRFKDCRKMAADDINCKCVDLGRECQKADVDNYTNCSYLNSPSKIFYIKKRYSALWLSPNNLFNASRYCIYRTFALEPEKYTSYYMAVQTKKCKIRIQFYQHDRKFGKTTEIFGNTTPGGRSARSAFPKFRVLQFPRIYKVIWKKKVNVFI